MERLRGASCGMRGLPHVPIGVDATNMTNVAKKKKKNLWKWRFVAVRSRTETNRILGTITRVSVRGVPAAEVEGLSTN